MNTSEDLDLGFINSATIMCILVLTGCRVVDWEHYDSECIYGSDKSIIKLNGYYQSSKAFCFLYEDGSSLHVIGFDSVEQFFSHAKKWSYEEDLKDYVRYGSGWGGFYISNSNEMIIQTLSGLSSGGFPVSIGVVERKGRLLNDSTFQIIQENTPQRKAYVNLKTPMIYKFMPYALKPDSTNWVKEKIKQKKK